MTDRIGADHRILSVIAPHSGSGKTLFVTHLLGHIDGLGCLKISPVHSQHEELEKGNLYSEEDFYFEKPSRLCQPGKDTALYLEAGACQVERLRHAGPGLRAGLEAAFQRFPSALPVVIESSSAIEHLNPVAVVLIIRPPVREMKPSTARLLHRVTDLVVNVGADGRGDAGQVRAFGVHPTGAHGDTAGQVAASGTHCTPSEAAAFIGSVCGNFEALRPVYRWYVDLRRESLPANMVARIRGLLSATGESSKAT